MCNWFITPQASFRTTPCTLSLWTISHYTPTFFQNTYYLTFYHWGLPRFQLLLTGNIKVTSPQTFHIHFFQKYYLRSLSQIHPMILVNIKVLVLQAIHYHPQGYQPNHHKRIHLIQPTLLLCHYQVCF